MIESGELSVAEDYFAVFGLEPAEFDLSEDALALSQQLRIEKYLQMQPGTVLHFVDTAESLAAMRLHVGRLTAASSAQQLPAIGLDCEWKPNRSHGEEKSPASLLQVS